VGDGLEGKEGRGIKFMQEDLISQPSLFLFLFRYLEPLGQSFITLCKVMLNHGSLPLQLLCVQFCLVSLGTMWALC
jgi:hypothetical protein